MNNTTLNTQLKYSASKGQYCYDANWSFKDWSSGPIIRNADNKKSAMLGHLYWIHTCHLDPRNYPILIELLETAIGQFSYVPVHKL